MIVANVLNATVTVLLGNGHGDALARLNIRAAATAAILGLAGRA